MPGFIFRDTEMSEPVGNKATALVIGLCSHGLAVARALAKEGVEVHALEKDRKLPGVSSRYIRQVIWIDSFSDSDLLNGLHLARETISPDKRVVLMPVNDNHVRFVGENWDKLSDKYLLSWSSCINEILMLQKKSELEKVCHERGLNYPRSATISSTADARTLTEDFGYPLILKPVRPLSSFKTEIARTPDELLAAVNRYQADFPLLCQEFIEGTDEDIYFVELLYDRGKPLGTLVGRKLLSHPPAQGQALIAESFQDKDSDLVQLALDFFSGLNLSGPLAIEFKRDPSGRYWVIEPTIGRTEFLVEIVISSGFNIPYLEYRLALGQSLPAPDEPRSVLWFDTERSPFSFLVSAAKHPEYFSRSKRILFPYFGHSDLKPFLHSLYRFGEFSLSRLFRPRKS